MKSFLSFFFSLSDLSLFLPNFVLPSPVIELTVGTIGKNLPMKCFSLLGLVANPLMHYISDDGKPRFDLDWLQVLLIEKFKINAKK